MKARITLVLIMFAAMFTLNSCFNMYPCTKGTGDIIKEERDIGSFDRIELQTIADVYFKQGDTHALRIQTDDNLMDLVRTEVSGNVLKIYTKQNICPEKLRIDIILKELKDIKVSGSGNIKCLNKLNTEDLSIAVLGSGDIRIPEINAQNIDIEISGSGDLFMEGMANRIVSEINGSGDIRCMGLKVKDAKIEINGSGDFAINVQDKLHIEINGSGNIEYKGNPSIKQEILGSGDIIKR